MSYSQNNEVPNLNAWLEHLRHANKSESTLRAYRQRVLRFAEWFELANGELLTPERVTPTDLREYKSYLLINLKRTPSTVNLSFVAIAYWLDFNGQNIPIRHMWKRYVLHLTVWSGWSNDHLLVLWNAKAYQGILR